MTNTDLATPTIGEEAAAAIEAALVAGALPGETDSFDDHARHQAAVFVGGIAAVRSPGQPAMGLESIGGDSVHRRTRLAIVNDDMPFLVDSVAGALAVRGIDIHRLLHPVLAVRRDSEGRLSAILPGSASGERRESMIYMEVDRVDAKLRRTLEGDLLAVLADVRAAVEDWPRLQDQHRNVEFYVIPFTSKAALITGDPTTLPVKPRGADEDTSALMDMKRLRDVFGPIPALRKVIADRAMQALPPEDMVDEGWKLLSNERPVRFNEMEFHLPREAQMAALKEVVAAIETHRSDVFFPIEVRTIAPDDAWLSPFYQRLSGSIAVHAYYKDDHQFLFDLVEPILRRHGGRPHWGKLNSLTAKDFAGLYPRFREAMEVRRALDPQGRLLNAYLKRALVEA